MSESREVDIDSKGLETLNVVANADLFNDWMYKTILPFCSGKILEIGSGIGNISRFFIQEGELLSMSDLRSNYCTLLRNRFPHADVYQVDLTHPEFDTNYVNLLEKFDTVFALNVVEHVEDDSLAIKNCRKLLTTEGKLVILVPAYQTLYNRFDVELGHYRRYTKRKLNDVFVKNQFRIIHTQYFNFMGIPGWYISGHLQKNQTIPRGQMELYNRLVPIFRLIDKLILNKAGLSVITIGQKV